MNALKVAGGFAAIAVAMTACGGSEEQLEHGQPAATSLTASYSNLENRGFCDNSASCWSSCSSIGYNQTNCGGTQNPLNTTFSYPKSIGGSSNDGEIWIGTDSGGGFGDAYWFTQLGSNYSSNIITFTYSTDIYVANSDGTYRAVEWDGNWFFGGEHYIFGLQDERKSYNVWRYYTPASGWISTGVPSTDLSGGWHHVTSTWTISGGNGYLTSFQIDGGTVHYGNGAWKSPAQSTSSNKATFGLQGDEYDTGMSLYYKNVDVSLN